jgi:2-polyprenyl-3-methyl-5-hydroxy-6-metoxy-1,4-benzoquinol methylase
MSTLWKNEELEYVTCDLCGSRELQALYTRSDEMLVAECKDCGLAFLNPRPKSGCIGKLYDETYFQKSSQDARCGYSRYLSDDGRRFLLESARIRLGALKRFWSPHGKRCLEIGCATGEFCQVLVRNGAVTTGVDLSEFVIQAARERYPTLDFRVSDIEAVSCTQKYDAVFAFELIEHVISPKTFLSAAKELIVDGGLLVLTTPNLDCGKKSGFERWIGFHGSFEHLYFLAPETLHRYGKATGLELTHWLTGCGDGIVRSPGENHQDSLKRGLTKGLRSLGLLETARRVRQISRDYFGIYRNHGAEHNLLAIFRKVGSSDPSN